MTVTRERLKTLRDQDLTRIEIAVELGITLAKVKRLLTLYSLVNRRNRRARTSVMATDDQSPEAGLTSVERARLRLGERMQDTITGYTLDGRPASIWDILDAAGIEVTDNR